MSRLARYAVPALAALLGGCNDLLLIEAERVPTTLSLSTDVVTVTEGSTVPLTVTVLDQNGEAFERIPGWAAPVWSFSAASHVEQSGQELRAVQPGATEGTVQVAGLSAKAQIRVNPRVLGLVVDGVYFTQSVQRYDGSVPLVAGRDALLRVFLRGDGPSFFRPGVRVHLYQDGMLQDTRTLSAEGDSIPTMVREGSYTGSWNTLVPGRLVRPGLSVVVEADPEGVVPLREGSRLRYPASGAITPQVVAVPKLWLRLVPINQTSHGTTGNVSVGNRDQWIRDLLAMFPIAEHDADVRTPYATSSSATTDLGWRELLMEIYALRAADGSQRYYYGILAHPGGNGIGGLGFIGAPAAVGYDALPRAAGTLAHELGHNFGRRHAPCGGPDGVDLSFPYADGGIGVFGYDFASGTVKVPSIEKDLMSYCTPEWISDYTYLRVLDFRRQGDAGTSGDRMAAAAEPTLLVWGRMNASGATLEPAFEITTRPSLPAEPGPYRVEGLDAAGAVLFSVSFRGERLAELDTDERQFAFTIPARLAHTDRLARLRLTGPGVRAERRPADPRAAGRDPGAVLRRGGGDRVRLEWEDEGRPMALVRDPRTGEVLSFARDGGAALRTRSPELEVLFSDGVRTTRRTLRVQ